MELRPYTIYRPVRTPDGEGGFTQSLPEPLRVNGMVAVYKNSPTLVVRRESDVRIDDIIVLDSQNV